MSLKPEKFATCCFGHLSLGMLQEDLTSEMFSIGPLKAPREYLVVLCAHTRTETESHHC